MPTVTRQRSSVAGGFATRSRSGASNAIALAPRTSTPRPWNSVSALSSPWCGLYEIYPSSCQCGLIAALAGLLAGLTHAYSTSSTVSFSLNISGIVPSKFMRSGLGSVVSKTDSVGRCVVLLQTLLAVSSSCHYDSYCR